MNGPLKYTEVAFNNYVTKPKLAQHHPRTGDVTNLCDKYTECSKMEEEIWTEFVDIYGLAVMIEKPNMSVLVGGHADIKLILPKPVIWKFNISKKTVNVLLIK